MAWVHLSIRKLKKMPRDAAAEIVRSAAAELERAKAAAGEETPRIAKRRRRLDHVARSALV